MIKFEYKKPRRNSGELRTPVTFYEYQGNDSPEPGEKEKKVLYQSWASVDEVWQKDIQLAQSNGTLDDVTLTIRNPYPEYQPSNKHYFSIDSPEFEDNRYNVKKVFPDLQDKWFIKIQGDLTS